jgi:DNA integrity scanning protein DisA with diadenylate cyclase activity
MECGDRKRRKIKTTILIVRKKLITQTPLHFLSKNIGRKMVSVLLQKFFQNNYLKTLTIIIIICTHVFTYQSIFPKIGNTFFSLDNIVVYFQ